MSGAPKIPASADCICDILRGRVVDKKISTASAGHPTGDLIRADLDITVGMGWSFDRERAVIRQFVT